MTEEVTQEKEVKQAAETEPASTASSTDQTASENTEQQESTQVDASSTEVQEDKTVPYSRFKEINGRLKETSQTVSQLQAKVKELESKASQPLPDPEAQQAREWLRSNGFMTREDIEAERAKTELAQKEIEQDHILEETLSSLEKEWDGKDGRPKFSRKEVLDFALDRGIPDPEIAFQALKKAEIIDWNVRTAIEKSRGVKSEVSDGSGSSQAGTTNDDLKTAISNGDKNALRAYLKRQLKT